MTREQLLRGINIVLGAAEYASTWTATTSDDKAVAALKVIVQQEWFLNLLAFVATHEGVDEQTVIDFVVKAKASE